MQTRLRTRFRDPNQNIYTNTDWLGYLNDALQDVQAASHFWPWMETRSIALSVLASTRSVALPTGVVGVTAVLNRTDRIPMRPFEGTAETFDQYPEQTETGVPYSYRVFGSTLEIYPLGTGATSLAVEYVVGSAELATGTDVPPWPVQYHRILVEGALARGYTDDGAPEQASLHQAAFNAILEDMKAALLVERHERYPQIVDNFWG